MTAAINQVVGQTQATIRWGLKYFANDDTCGVNNGAAVDVGPNNGTAIANSIAMTMPGGSTDAPGRASGAAYLMGVTDPNPGRTSCWPPTACPTARPSATPSQGTPWAPSRRSPTPRLPGSRPSWVGVGSVPDAATTLTQMAINGAVRRWRRPATTRCRTLPTCVGPGHHRRQIASCTFGAGAGAARPDQHRRQRRRQARPQGHRPHERLGLRHRHAVGRVARHLRDQVRARRSRTSRPSSAARV